MPYIAFELDALAGAPDVARAAGVAEDAIIAGHARMWAWCWKAKRDVVVSALLRGFYGADVATALVAFGFLELVEGGFRVKGAARYLRLASGQSRGGHASKGNLRRGREPGGSRRGVPEGEPGESRGGAGDSAGEEPRLSPGPTSSIEHRASNSTTPQSPPQGGGVDPISAPSALNVPAVTAGALPERRAEPRVELAYEADSLDERFKRVWREERGSEMDWKQRRDGEAVREVLRLSRDDWVEAERVWRRALRMDFPKCLGLKTLVEHWPTYAGRDPPKPAARGRASEADKDWSGPPPAVTADGDVVF